MTFATFFCPVWIFVAILLDTLLIPVISVSPSAQLFTLKHALYHVI